ncbi:MAG: RhtB family transporter [Thermomicrobiales bacterium]|nr:MAG: RhtB family transporter [Thermomicrobiales bacterium]
MTLPDTSTLLVFVLAALALLLIPGPAVLYIVARGIQQGRAAGVVSALGVGAGGVMHVLAATAGLSALLLSSALAFSVVKYLGAAYLLFLGIRTLRGGGSAGALSEPPPMRLWRMFLQGAIVNVLNPKVALFFFAFLPQFVDPARGDVTGQLLFFGCLYVTLGIMSDSAYGLLAGTAGHWLRARPRFLRRQRLVSGSIYIGLGLTAALTGSRKP